MSCRRRVAALALAAAFHGLGCAGDAPLWEDRPALTDELVESLLRNADPAVFDRDLVPSEIPVVPVKQRLRPCCAFGHALKPELASIPIPGVVLQNITSVEALGPHRYDSGVLSRAKDEDQVQSGEENGLVYTCRGGFIDVAHVRDYADWTMFLAPTMARILEQGGRIALPDEGGARAVVLQPLSSELIETYGLRRIAVSMAVWLSFQVSIWHEIATWYGWSALPLFPERASAFSPEDLYSNALGARLAGGVIAVRAAATDRTYDRTLDRWTRAALRELGAVDAELGTAAADQVDGLWWDSQRRLPDERLVLRRAFYASTRIEPWTVGASSAAASVWEQRHCGPDVAPLRLRIPDRLGEIHFPELVTLEIRLEEALRARVYSGDGVVTQADFPRIIDVIRTQARIEFGPRVDRRER